LRDLHTYQTGKQLIEDQKMDMPRTIRYQAAIIRGEDILLIKHREHGNGRAYWLLPGGGIYQRFKTYLCRPITNEASPGFEPEAEAAASYAIVEVGWYNLNDETTWDELIVNDPITAPALRRIRTALAKVNANSVGNDRQD
jgi:hypothetical protein